MKVFKFKDDFLFGGSSNPMQTEGYGNFPKGKVTWDKFFETSPNKFFNGVGPIKLNDFQNHYQEDIKLMKESGIEVYRYSVQWAALFPDGKTLSHEALEWYHRLFKEFKKNNIKIIIPLVHFDTPFWAQEMGGWASLKVRQSFYKYAKFVFDEFKDDVYQFLTFLEPVVMVQGILFGFHWPQVKTYKEAFEVMYGIIHAHALAIKAFRESGIKNKMIGAVFNDPQVYPASSSPKDVKAAKMCKMLWNEAMMEPMIAGKFKPELIKFWRSNNLTPKMTDSQLKEISLYTSDYIGVDYYQPSRAAAPIAGETKKTPWPFNYYSVYRDTNARMNLSRGWEIYPKGIYDSCMELKKLYKNKPIYIMESGMGVQGEEKYLVNGKVEDKYRIDFLAEHLYWLHKSIEEGVDVKAYLMWTPIDNWSWTNAYKNRYGLIRIDLNDLSRHKKASSDAYAKWSKTKTVEWDDQNIHPLIAERRK